MDGLTAAMSGAAVLARRTTTGHRVARGAGGSCGGGAERCRPPRRPDELPRGAGRRAGRLHPAPALGAGPVGALGARLPRRRDHACSSTPAGWAGDSLAGIDLLVLRSWLAGQATRGMARATLARRAAAARSFTAWAPRDRPARHRPRGAARRRRAAGRTLPGVLRQDEADALLDVAGLAADDDEPDRGPRPGRARGALRQRHPGRRAVRARPRRRRPRPPGAAGARQGRQGAGGAARARRPLRAVDPGCAEGRPRAGAGRAAAPRCSSARAAAGSTRARSGGRCTPCWRTSPEPLTWGRTASAIRLPPTCWKEEPT